MNKYQEALDKFVSDSKLLCELQLFRKTQRATAKGLIDDDRIKLQELIDKETPKKPIKIEFKFTEEELEWITNEDDKYRYECPHCHIEECRRNVPDCWNDDYVYEMTKRCDECGGLLDWSENE
jgi:hypothetical protein